MLNREKHQLIMGKILREIYNDISISSLLGFKGGTCAYFFYGLTRFSVDLDFDLFLTDEVTQGLVYKKMATILGRYGEIKDKHIKRNTVFFLLSYGDTDHNIKIEINTRALMPDIKKYYEVKEYLGISILVGKKEYLFSSKLVALTMRSETAMRDIYDIWYFAQKNWEINPEIIRTMTKKAVGEYLGKCILIVEKVKNNEIMRGLGELLSDEKEKYWVRNHLQDETVFLLKNYQTVLK